MSYSFDTAGWDLFKSPFRESVITAPPKQQAGRTQQKPSEASRHNTTQTAAQRNALPAQKAPQPSRQVAGMQQKQSGAQKPEPALETAAPVLKPVQDNNPKPEQAVSVKDPVPASTQPAASQKELVIDMSSGSGAAPAHDAA